MISPKIHTITFVSECPHIWALSNYKMFYCYFYPVKYRSNIFHQEENKNLNWFGRHFPHNAPGIHCAKKKGILINCRHLVDLSVCVAWSCSESKNEAAVMEKGSLLRVNTFIWLAPSSRPVLNSWLSQFILPPQFLNIGGWLMKPADS